MFVKSISAATCQFIHDFKWHKGHSYILLFDFNARNKKTKQHKKIE